jgi:polyisoprenoid-binding protein YceI
MKNLYLIFGLALILSACGNNKNAEKASTNNAVQVEEATGQKYLLVKDKSELHWRGTKPAGQHIGTVDFAEGYLTLDGNKITGGSFTIDLNTIVNTDLENEDMNARLVGHLKSADFFDVSNFPYAKFEIASIEPFQSETESPNGFKASHLVSGNLSIKGITKNITFPVLINLSDDTVVAFSEEFSIDRTLWNVNFKSKSVFAEFKDDFIGDLINIKLKMEFKI